MLITRLFAIGLLLSALPAFGHTIHEATFNTWSFEVPVFLPIVLFSLAYISGIFHLYYQKILKRILNWGHGIAFILGILALVIALMSPLDVLAETFFSAHMTQHLILMLVVPPLLIMGRMEIVLLWTFPIPIRRMIGQIWHKCTGLRSILNFLMQPMPTWLLMSVAMWFWHIPGPYAWAYNNPNIHILEHMSFLLTSLAFWALVLRPYSRHKDGHGTALLLLMTFALESSLLGALLAFSGHSYYSVNASTVLHDMPNLLSSISPLQDQQLAGLIMWVPASLVQLVVLGAIFIDWFSETPKKLKLANLV